MKKNICIYLYLLTPPQKFVELPQQQKLKKIIQKRHPQLSFSFVHGKGDTIRISQEIQCLPYAGFTIEYLVQKLLMKMC